MRALWCGCCCLYLMLAFALGGICTAPRSVASPGPTVLPGMEIRQGTSSCTVGFVEPQLRVALTTGRCGDGSVVSDADGTVLGSVVVAHHNATATGTPGEGSILSVEYEVIELAPGVAAADLLPNGNRLESSPGLEAQEGMPVCHFGKSTEQTCGHVASTGNGRFTIPDMTVDKSTAGEPVYVLTDDNRVMIVGLLDDTGTPVPQAESWQAIMKQLYVDTHGASPQAPLPVVRIAGAHQVLAG